MRRAILFAMLPALLSAADVRIDHVTAAGTSLQDMMSRLASIGIQAEAGGPHSNHATEMALVSFPDGSYLELIALQPDADPKMVEAHTWSKFLRANAGPCAWAVRPADFAAEVKRLEAAGVPVNAPVRSGRQRPDGVRLEWETAQVGTGPNGTFFPFLIHDFTPREQRAYPRGKPSTKDFKGVARVVIAVANLQEAIERYRKAFGLPAPIKQVDAEFGAQLALLGGIPVTLAAPLNAQSWLADRVAGLGEAPCAFILEARKPGRYRAAAKSRWFGNDVTWMDSAKLGWRLGFE